MPERTLSCRSERLTLRVPHGAIYSYDIEGAPDGPKCSGPMLDHVYDCTCLVAVVEPWEGAKTYRKILRVEQIHSVGVQVQGVPALSEKEE